MKLKDRKKDIYFDLMDMNTSLSQAIKFFYFSEDRDENLEAIRLIKMVEEYMPLIIEKIERYKYLREDM